MKKRYHRYFDQYKEYKLLSFFYTIILVILYTCQFFVNKQTSQYSLLFSIIIFYLLALTLLMLSYSTTLMAFKKMNAKDANAYSFVAIIKNPVNSIAILFVLIFLYVSAGYNLAFFVIFGPFLYGLGVLFSLVKIHGGK
ncbi:hypothetical protein [Metabacillus sp. Hm71]|uniref:hypothetical protein n=1 Tax=Metabacillus sp. Hm71 TaxID=3450743 RepID=UPI003F4296F4